MRIILIGPPAVGKSTTASILSDRLELPHAPMDRLRFGYYAPFGYDFRIERQCHDKGGFPAVVQYWKPFEARAVASILADYPVGVIDFGAGHSHYEDPSLFELVRAALAPEPNVVLLMPSDDDDEALRIIGERIDLPRDEPEWDVIAGQVRHPSNRRLAKHVVITGARNPEQVADAVLDVVVR